MRQRANRQRTTTPLHRIGAVLLASLALITLAGCGGSGAGTGVGGSSVGGSAGSTASPGTTSGSGLSAMDVYVTDGFSDQYKQVLVTLYKVEVTTDGTTFQTVFSSTAGQTLDLSSLSATAELLASVSVPAGSYTQARITFGNHVTLVKPDGTSTSVAVDPSVGTQANGQVALTVAAPTHAMKGQTSTLLVDFKLAAFQLVGNALRPAVGCGGTGQMGGKHLQGHLIGVVSALTSTGFTLQGPDGHSVAVILTSTTTLDGGPTGRTLTLANGQNVVVDGTFDATKQTVTAISVALGGPMDAGHQQASGTVTSVSSGASSFVLTVEHADGFQPTGGTITVVTSAATHFDKGGHQAGTLADVTTGGSVHVDGMFNAASQTLTATFVGLH